jgi:hypothetical protein
MLLGGKTVFPITLSSGPPLGKTDPISGLDGWTEVKQTGVHMLRVWPHWNAATAAQQIRGLNQHELRCCCSSRAVALGWALQRRERPHAAVVA